VLNVSRVTGLGDGACVLNVSRVTGLGNGTRGSSTNSGKGITSSTNNADRRWSPHIILANVYRR
jgi:hypothetical protein